MFGVLMYIFFLLLGYIYSCFMFKNKDLYMRIWMGGIIGNLIPMFGIILPSLFLGFTRISHLILILLSVLPLVYLVIKKGKDECKKIILNEGGANTSGITNKVFLFVLLPIMLLIVWIFTNHILTPFKNGGLAGGQSTFGDLQMHLGFINSIAEQQVFPPKNPFLSGGYLNYPFLVNMLSSSLCVFGTPLRLAVLLPSYVLSALLVMGFYIIAYRLTAKRLVAILATIFFFIGGGFGFAYFLNGAKADISVFTNIFTGYYKTPTNLNDYNIRWANPICDMIIPQRTTMAGWCLFFPTLWLLLEALEKKERKYYIILGVLAGCLPMIHTHTLLGLGVISAVLFFAYLGGEENKKEYVLNWVLYGAIVAVLALPQLFFWTFSQTSGNDSFLRFSFNWVNHNDTYFWFYLKNWGITAIFAVPAVLVASKENKKLLLACGVLFCLAELVLFQPNEYDNNKLIFLAYMILLIAVCNWLVYMWDTLKGIKGRTYLAVIIIISATLSGALSIIREIKSGGDYQLYSRDDVAMADYIKENIPSDALFLTDTHHLNPVVSLAGRNIYVGSSLYVFFHGDGDEYYKRNKEVETVYSGKCKDLNAFCKERSIDYIYVGSNEVNKYKPDNSVFSELERVYTIGTETLYKVK